MSSRPVITDMSPEELEAFVRRLGLKPFRARQILEWIYRHNALSFEEMTSLSRPDRERLNQEARLAAISIRDRKSAEDGAEKFLLELSDGHFIESVLIEEPLRRTLCLSTQVGCRIGCRFCATGKRGLYRNLEVHEIIGQCLVVQQAIGKGRPINNLVLMGMGEPLDNYQKVIKAIGLILSDRCLDFSKRRVTLSTCGLADKIERLSSDGFDANLAVSLNAPNDELRSSLMRINRKYPLARLLEACRKFQLQPRRMITFEYVMIQGVNDTPREALRLAQLLKEIRCKINLIPFNPYPEVDFRRPEEASVQAFRQVLIDHHYTATIRISKGAEIQAACGQLAGGPAD